MEVISRPISRNNLGKPQLYMVTHPVAADVVGMVCEVEEITPDQLAKFKHPLVGINNVPRYTMPVEWLFKFEI